MLNGTPAKRWFDLPDTVLNMIEEQKGSVLAIGGGPIVSDMIQRAHNMGLKMNIMKGVEGASNDKSESLEGNNYSFTSPKQLISRILKENKDLVRSGITPEKIDEMIKESYANLVVNKGMGKPQIENEQISPEK